MASVTLKNVPDDLHQWLKARAAQHHRTLRNEIIATLEALPWAEPFDPQAFLERVRRLRPDGHEHFRQEDFDSPKGEDPEACHPSPPRSL